MDGLDSDDEDGAEEETLAAAAVLGAVVAVDADAVVLSAGVFTLMAAFAVAALLFTVTERATAGAAGTTGAAARLSVDDALLAVSSFLRLPGCSASVVVFTALLAASAGCALLLSFAGLTLAAETLGCFRFVPMTVRAAFAVTETGRGVAAAAAMDSVAAVGLFGCSAVGCSVCAPVISTCSTFTSSSLLSCGCALMKVTLKKISPSVSSTCASLETDTLAACTGRKRSGGEETAGAEEEVERAEAGREKNSMS